MKYSEFQQLCEDRRTIRYFSDEPLSQADILAVLECANLAPNVENVQPWRFHVVYNKEMLEKLMKATCYGNFVLGAGAFIVVTCKTLARPASQQILWNPKELEYSCVAAMDHILLAATAKGLGTGWVSLHKGPAHEALGLHKDEIVIGGIMIGHFRRGEEGGHGLHNRHALKDTYKFYE